jgi:hypothetical protein
MKRKKAKNERRIAKGERKKQMKVRKGTDEREMEKVNMYCDKPE